MMYMFYDVQFVGQYIVEGFFDFDFLSIYGLFD